VDGEDVLAGDALIEPEAGDANYQRHKRCQKLEAEEMLQNEHFESVKEMREH